MKFENFFNSPFFQCNHPKPPKKARWQPCPRGSAPRQFFFKMVTCREKIKKNKKTKQNGEKTLATRLDESAVFPHVLQCYSLVSFLFLVTLCKHSWSLAGSFSGPVHSMVEKCENSVIFLRLGLPFTLIRHENRASLNATLQTRGI